MTVLTDTSIWVDFLKLGQRGPGAALSGLLRDRDVLMCGQVAAELLAGTDPDHRDQLWTLLSGLPWVALRPHAWRRVGEVAGDLRGRGAAVPLTDVQIAVLVAEHSASLWTRDRHFDAIAELPLGLTRFEPPAP
ncbi:MAG TPA: PIN domain-containing protein [Candidatus Binatia bacterium]|nr:PIN domain-containing protein [Candidatus Binatia bacterium]